MYRSYFEAVEDLEIPEEAKTPQQEELEIKEKSKIASKVSEPIAQAVAQTNNKLSQAFEKFYNDENERIQKVYDEKIDSFKTFQANIQNIATEYSKEASKTIDQIVKANEQSGTNQILINFLQLGVLKFIDLTLKYADMDVKESDYRKAKETFEKYFLGKLKNRLPEEISAQI